MSENFDTQQNICDKISENCEEKSILVDFNNFATLRKNGIAFHWWDSQATSLHRHNHYEFFIITQGAVKHQLNDVTKILEKNTLCVILPTDVHRLSPLSNQLCIHLNIALTEKKLAQICNVLSLDESKINSFQVKQLALSESERNFFLQRAEQICFLNETTKNSELSNTLLVEMAIEIISLFIKRENIEENVFPLWFSQIISQMHSPEFLDKSVKDVYALSNYSAPVIIKYFKLYTGKTILKYLTEIKMSNACEFLKHSSMTTLSIASRLGYSSLSHFNKLFKETTKMTPSTFKMQNH